MSDSRLRACPFCGSTAAPALQQEGRTRFLVLCERYCGGCEGSTGSYTTADEAIRVWNCAKDNPPEFAEFEARLQAEQSAA